MIEHLIEKHNLPIKQVKIGNNLAVNCPALLKNLGFENDKILVISDEKIFKNCQKYFKKLLEEESAQTLILKNPKADEKTLKTILTKIKKLKKSPDLILVIGSGTLSDLAKLASHQLQIPYAIFASAASMNGYLSKNASILIKGHKKTLPATLPIAVFADLEIIKSAPKKLTKAGIGDSLCFYGCWFDWYLSHLILGTKFNEELFLNLKPNIDFIISNYKKLSLSDEKLIKNLIEILLITGLNMTVNKSSEPASQSEHLIAHLLEMKYGKNFELLHGLQIAITSLTTAKIQKEILAKKPLKIIENILSEKQKSELKKFFGNLVFKECKKEFEKKLIDKNFAEKINLNLEKNWSKYKKNLAKIHLEEKKLKEIFQHFKISTSSKNFKIKKSQYDEVVKNAKFIRSRFTCLDI